MSNGINFAATLENATMPPDDYLPAPRAALDIEAAKERLQIYVGAVARMVEEAEALKIESEQDNERAVALGTSAKKLFNQIEDRRKAIVNEPNDFIKSVNGFCKVFSDKLKSVEDGMKRKISQYRAVQEQRRREEELRAKREAEELQKKLNAEAKEKGTEPVQVAAPILPKQQAPVRTETGSAAARKVWTFEVEDLDRVPRKYLSLNEKAVRDDIRAGVRNIEGLKIFEDARTTFRTA